MNQTPVHEFHNPDLLKIIPPDLDYVVEVGCSSGALADEYVKLNPGCNYVGLEIDANYADLASRYCKTIVGDIESFGESFYIEHSRARCWIFGDTLEHLRDPWNVLKK